MPDQPTPGFAARLKQLREAAGLTQGGLAERAGMHKLGVAKLEQGLREPAWATVQALARALGVGCSAFEGTDGRAAEVRPKMGRPPKAKGAADVAPIAEASTPDAPPAKPKRGRGKPGAKGGGKKGG